MFENKILLITGGTGSFGSTVLRRFINEPFSEIRIFSRDEKKQEDQRLHYRDARLRYYIGDIRDIRAVASAVQGVDYIFHAAALKQVPSCEFHPMEAVKTNVIGTDNLLEAAIAAGVERVVCLSTDKAVYPINAMGISKAMMEKVVVAKSRLALNTRTTITATRYGNVLASRGSVIPLFVDQVRKGLPLTLTDPAMTRFVMTLAEAVDLVLYAFEHGRNGDMFVQKAPSATIQVLAQSVLEVLGKPDHPMKIIGTRHGEKLFETLLSREEMAVAEDRGDYYRVPPDNRDLNYAVFVEEGERRISEAADFNSHNTDQLDQTGMTAILHKLDYMQAVLSGEAGRAD
ncbi:polysaccharide biosynthesis protein [Sphingomonas sp. dw_22]|uniref:polysaccharide biosynthesis protein n=1 Tax=Sphingomonas sp. dw_22 TaxID=2721175 RepID=UPI001BD2FBC1|nr:polysaccharide biosynthesis protein [Sphingomonas sp. dw_22]